MRVNRSFSGHLTGGWVWDSGYNRLATGFRAPESYGGTVCDMLRGFAISVVCAALVSAGLTLVSLEPARPEQQASSEVRPQNNPQPPSDAELRARAERLVRNQHNDDEALEQFERVERQWDKTGGSNPRVLEDRTFRVVPTGTGTFKLLLRDGDKLVDPAEYRRQLQEWKQLLELALKPDDSKAKAAYAKFQKRKRDRAELVTAARDAFLPKWAGQETHNGRVCDVIELNPNPNFHPRSLLQDALTHATAKIWVDLETDHLVRGEAHITRDISFGGGILGKLYRGGVFSLEQTEVAPGIWLPARYQYDFMGRKFLFTFEQHQYIEASQYRRVGPPKQALAIVQNELASGKSFNGDP